MGLYGMVFVVLWDLGGEESAVVEALLCCLVSSCLVGCRKNLCEERRHVVRSL